MVRLDLTPTIQDSDFRKLSCTNRLSKFEIPPPPPKKKQRSNYKTKSQKSLWEDQHRNIKINISNSQLQSLVFETILIWYFILKILKCTRVLWKKCQNECLISSDSFLKRYRTQRWSLNLFCEIRSLRFSTFEIQISIFQAWFLKREIFCNLSLWLLIFHFQAAILEITLCHLFSKFWWFRLWWLHFDCRSLIFGHQTWKSLNSQTTSSFQNSNFKKDARIKSQNSKHKKEKQWSNSKTKFQKSSSKRRSKKIAHSSSQAWIEQLET